MVSMVFRGRTWRNRWVSIALLAGLIAAAFLVRQLEQTDVGDVEGHATAIDGDSLYVAGREVRLQGIDAPEGQQVCRRGGAKWECGEAATQELTALIGGQTVRCEGLEIDKHGRLLALCFVGNLNLNQEMVIRGFAVAYGRYGSEEREAANSNRGLWAGEFERPRDWRRERGIGN
ncbi:Nuclease (SNase domain protein) [Candidatus Filomicrobium marinum]|uniref:Nuclease (SNase domain protein) n=1 Tax=Candidatus Filomicrobium marinum TaxID=1608628 RepID=A0A0D6JJ02_9HYPH|nr:Nuclease (SNase domain protein) [Candidatus Filomicrobium marinum]CPR21901.1 Nuclease (SNase domain protein) [Candidatus Filomicrobium marinum]